MADERTGGVEVVDELAATSVVSKEFIVAVKLSDRPAYRIAQAARVNPSVLSRIIRGAERIRPGDPRVLAVAKVLGLAPGECFANPDSVAAASVVEAGLR